MSSTTVELRQGTTGWIISTLGNLLPALNTDLAAKVTGGVAAVPFSVQVGDAVSAGRNLLCAVYSGDTARRFANNEKLITVMMKVVCLIPTAGENSTANFEMAREVAADHVTTAFDDDEIALTPKINAGLLGATSALGGERGAVVDIFPRLMADRVTVVRGWEMSYQLSFALKTR